MAAEKKVAFKHFADRRKPLSAELISEEFSQIQKLSLTAEKSKGIDEWLLAIRRWNSLSAYFYGELRRANFAMSGNMNDKVKTAAYSKIQSEFTPVFEDGESEFLKLLLRSRHRAKLSETLGEYFFKRLDAEQPTLDPRNSDLRQKARELATQYGTYVAQGELVVNSVTMTLSQAAGLQIDPDRSTRRTAFEEYRKWFVTHHDPLAQLFDQIVKVSDQMGKNLGYPNFIPIGYAGMGRTDYTPKEVRSLRENIKKYFVPLQSKFHKHQAEELGTETLLSWDSGHVPSFEIPSDAAPVATQIESASRLFKRMSPILSQYFETIKNNGLIDLENRTGKRAGAFCTTFPDEEKVAIFCNSTGQATDIRTLIHESGHAFAFSEAMNIEFVALRHPTLDACEIHSMGMEFLALKYINEFLPEKYAERFHKKRWRDSLEVLTYAPIVDEFQHFVYENPACTPHDRDLAWNRIHDDYRSSIDFTGHDDYKWARWYAQLHIFQLPFYYIDYVIAEIGAMQLALMDSRDPDLGLSTFLKLCKIGGTKSVLEIFSTVGMRSPFDEALIKDLAEHTKQLLKL